jgi:hypothetical protein
MISFTLIRILRHLALFLQRITCPIFHLYFLSPLTPQIVIYLFTKKDDNPLPLIKFGPLDVFALYSTFTPPSFHQSLFRTNRIMSNRTVIRSDLLRTLSQEPVRLLWEIALPILALFSLLPLLQIIQVRTLGLSEPLPHVHIPSP